MISFLFCFAGDFSAQQTKTNVQSQLSNFQLSISHHHLRELPQIVESLSLEAFENCEDVALRNVVRGHGLGLDLVILEVFFQPLQFYENYSWPQWKMLSNLLFSLSPGTVWSSCLQLHPVRNGAPSQSSTPCYQRSLQFENLLLKAFKAV